MNGKDRDATEGLLSSKPCSYSGVHSRTGSIMSGLALTVSMIIISCGSNGRESDPVAALIPSTDVVFTDVTTSAGIDFEHYHGRSGRKYLPETLGSGCAFFDYNGDDLPDIFLVNSQPWVIGSNDKPTSKLYHNNGDGTFLDVTTGSGLDKSFYGVGVAPGDYDNDGKVDLYVTTLGRDLLFRNHGNGRFSEIAEQAGIDNSDFGTSAAWFDYDKDGNLDIFVANYVSWTIEKDLWCSLDGESKSYCTPESYRGVSSRLYRNRGNGQFDDVTEVAGMLDDTAKALGVAVLDFDQDGFLDVFQANDTQPNKLYRNQGNGTFKNLGLIAGVAFAEDGTARGAMGVDAADYDRSGFPHLLVGNFSNEMLSLFHNEGEGLFVDDAPTSAVGRESLLSLTFGAFFFDYDLDGFLDIFAANGHLEEEIGKVQPKVSYRQPPLLFRNLQGKDFELVNNRVGSSFSRPIVARGAAYADYDADGDLDILVTTNNGPAYLFRNDGGNDNSYLRLRLIGQESNRDAIGTVVRVVNTSGTQWQIVRSGSSYASQSELVLTFGMGRDPFAERVEIEWPSGKQQTYEKVEANRQVTVLEEVEDPGQ